MSINLLVVVCEFDESTLIDKCMGIFECRRCPVSFMLRITVMCYLAGQLRSLLELMSHFQFQIYLHVQIKIFETKLYWAMKIDRTNQFYAFNKLEVRR